MTLSPDRRKHLFALVAMALLALPFAVSSTVLPWGRDQGIYGHAASRLLDGWLPYSQTFVFKPPATIFVHAMAMLAFGRDMLSIRAFDVLWTLATGALLYGIAFRATNNRSAALFTGAVYAWQYHRINYWSSAQTDAWANLPIAVAVWLVLTEAPNLGKAVLAGVAVGAAFWFKYTVGGILPVVVLLPLLRRGRGGLPEAAGVLGGFALAVGGGLAVMAALGNLDDFVQIQREVVFPYTGATGPTAGDGIARKSFTRFLTGVGTFTTPSLALCGLGVLAITFDLARRRTLDDRAVAGLAAIGWAGAGLLSAYAQGKFFGYQYLTTLGAIGLLVPIGISGLADLIPRGRWVALGAAAILLYQAGSNKPFPHRWDILGKLATGKTTLDREYDRGNYAFPDMSLDDNVTVASWLREHTPPDEPVFVWSYDPMIYVLADREMVSRFPYTFPMVVPWSPVATYEAELMAALRAQPPSAIVVGSKDGVRVVMGHRKDSRKTLSEFEELNAFVAEKYAEPVPVARFQVYLRRGELPEGDAGEGGAGVEPR